VVIDLDIVEANIARLQGLCDAAGIANRPHIKTHKSPVIAAMQVAGGAKGITCQKLGEAEVMADAGIDDILISYNLLGDEKMARLGALQAKANMTVAADNAVVVADLPKAAAASGRPLSVVVECDTGRKRAGVETPAEAIALAREIAASKGLQFAGFMLYPTETGWADAQKFYDEALAGVRALGLDATMVSTGGSPNLINLGKLKGATEHRPGTYIYNDRMQVAAGVAGWDDCALNIYSTVVSRAGPERGILDAGSKTLTSDPGGGLDGYGLILEHPEAKIAKFAEEHGFLDLARSNTRPNVGDIVRIVPNHVCVVVNMMDEVVMVRGEEIVGVLPVAARGKLR
jgi:D-serine deaminase-like pyridoxal phosphate-dependent protein